MEEIPELMMDLNALSKLTSVSERINEPHSAKAESSAGFETSFLNDEVDEQDNEDVSGNPLPQAGLLEKPEGKNAASGSGFSNDIQTKTVLRAETSLDTAEGGALGPVPSDDNSILRTSMASGSPDDLVVKPAGPDGTVQVPDTSHVGGNGLARVEDNASGPPLTIGMPETPTKTPAGSAPHGTDLPDPKAPQVTSTTAAEGQLIAPAETAQPPAAAGDPNTFNSQSPKPHTVATMSLLERHLGGHAVRFLPDNSQSTAASHEMEAHGVQQAGNLIDAKDGSTAALPQSGLTDLAKAQATQRLMASQSNADLLSNAAQGDMPQEAVWDVRPGTASTGVAAGTPIAVRPELAANISHQMAEAMRVALDRSVEIALNPKELGRVRMVLSPSDAGVTLNILAERPETLELMRRNIDDLAKSFADLGYEDISFSFDQNEQMTDDSAKQSGDAHDGMSGEPDVSGEPTIPIIPTSQLVIAPDGVDMRL
ncbi:MAG: flagellar hook-length control protein FliK [Tateyamaria sp.]|uniref:flagellar hook-length control protein FliK n=1 Tax=Tateyamaria sp. TaxID=1929288 RepID=UPI0032DD715B